MANAYSSAQRSVAAFQPFYPPPVTPASEYVKTTDALAENVNAWGMKWDQHSRMVSRDPRRIGIRTLFSYGAQLSKWFRMIATGQVESTKFQPYISHKWSGEFNDALYQAGYPRNLGTTFKVVTVNKGINPPWQQLPRTDFRGRAVYTNRRPVTSGVEPIPAVPTQGRWS